MPPANLDLYLADLQQRALAYQFLQASEELPFAAKSAQLSEQAQSQLQRMTDFLRSNPDTVARIVSYPEDLGGVVINLQLAEQRAARVREYLIAQGIAADRLMTARSTQASSVVDKAMLAGQESLPGPQNSRKVQIFLQKRELAPCPPGP